MKYEKFFECVRENVAKYMGGDYEVTLNKVVKNNGLELTGLVIMEKGKSAAPTIYLDDFYAEYTLEKAMGRIVEEIVDIYEANRNKLEVDFSAFINYEVMKSKIVYKLLNYEANQKLLEDVPHKHYMDLAIVFYVIVDSDTIGSGSILIHNNHANVWKVSEDDLYEAAMSNTPKLMQYRFSSMESVVGEIIGANEAKDVLENEEISRSGMYVLTNTRKMFGAACLLYDGLLKRISNKLKSDLYIIPSSIHELIIIPQNMFPRDKEELLEMVCSINASDVDIVDVLSDNVYEYKRELDKIVM